MNDADLQKFRQMKEMFSQHDSDSFASFTGGLRSNWYFVMAIFAVGFWIVTNVNDSKNTNIIQDGKIDGNAKAVEILTTNVTTLTTEMHTNQREADGVNSEIIRRLDLLQKDVDTLKSTK